MSAKTPPFKRYYVIRKIKDDTCVYEFNQNQILSTARTWIILDNPVSFRDTISVYFYQIVLYFHNVYYREIQFLIFENPVSFSDTISYLEIKLIKDL